MSNRSAGQSIHIGLNNVNPDSYSFYVPPLKGCRNDAYAMRDVAARHGYRPSLFTDGAATAANVTAALTAAVSELQPDQTVLVTYAGHGSQVEDINRDEQDPGALDETWVLFDRQLIDDELAAIWSQAPAGSRILIVSDSCHSGTVARLLNEKAEKPPAYRVPGLGDVQIRYGDVRKAATAAVAQQGTSSTSSGAGRKWTSTVEKVVGAGAEAIEQLWGQVAGIDVWRKSRMLDPDLAQRDLDERQDLYRPYLSLAAGGSPIQASVLLLSACSDNQTALDGRDHGLFTQELLAVLESGQYQAYDPFIAEIAKRVNLNDHMPGLYWASEKNDDFAGSAPFTP